MIDEITEFYEFMQNLMQWQI